MKPEDRLAAFDRAERIFAPWPPITSVYVPLEMLDELEDLVRCSRGVVDLAGVDACVEWASILREDLPPDAVAFPNLARELRLHRIRIVDNENRERRRAAWTKESAIIRERLRQMDAGDKGTTP